MTFSIKGFNRAGSNFDILFFGDVFLKKIKKRTKKFVVPRIADSTQNRIDPFWFICAENGTEKKAKETKKTTVTMESIRSRISEDKIVSSLAICLEK